MNRQSHRRLIEVEIMVAWSVVLAHVAGMAGDDEVQLGTDRGSRCWRRREGLHRRSLRLRCGARVVVRKRSPPLPEARGVHAWNHRHDVCHVCCCGGKSVSIVG